MFKRQMPAKRLTIRQRSPSALIRVVHLYFLLGIITTHGIAGSVAASTNLPSPRSPSSSFMEESKTELARKMTELESSEKDFYALEASARQMFEEHADFLAEPMPSSFFRLAVDSRGDRLPPSPDLSSAEYLIEVRMNLLSAYRDDDSPREIAILRALKSLYPQEFRRVLEGFVARTIFGHCNPKRQKNLCVPTPMRVFLKKREKTFPHHLRGYFQELFYEEDSVPSKASEASEGQSSSCTHQEEKIIERLLIKTLQSPEVEHFRYHGSSAVQRNLNLDGFSKIDLRLTIKEDQIVDVQLLCEADEGKSKNLLDSDLSRKQSFISALNQQRHSLFDGLPPTIRKHVPSKKAANK